MRAAEQDRPDIQKAREQWAQDQQQWDARRLVFLDETGLNTKMTPRYGWAARSERCPGKAPHGHWNTSTFIGALRYDGMQAPWLIDGPMNGEGFITYLEQVLAPTLKQDDIVICDNLSSHKVARAQQIVEQVGASLIYLPPYSPDLNPIENAFSKLKSMICRAAARTFEQLLEAVAEALDKLTSQDCSNYFKHAKYRTY